MDYPKAIYHPVHGAKTIHGPQELESALLGGWSEERRVVATAEDLRAAIRETEARLGAMREELDRLELPTQNFLAEAKRRRKA